VKVAARRMRGHAGGIVVQPEPSKNPKGFAQISTAAVRGLLSEDAADIDVFLPGSNNNAVLYRGKGQGEQPGDSGAHRAAELDFERLSDHGVSQVFVRAEDLVRCEHALESRLRDLLANPALSSSDRAEIVHSTGSAVAREIMSSSLSSESITRAANLTDGIVEGVLNDPHVAGYVLQMAGHERATASHMQMVSTLAVVLGAEIYGEDPEALKSLALAGMLHDVGKLSVPAEILHKEGPLTEFEVQLIQQHPIESVRLIGNDPTVSGDVRRVILQHHERLDGRGYPLGLTAADIHPHSRLLSIVDSFHAMIGPRTYRASLGVDDANRVMGYQAGRQFDKDLLERWVALCERHESVTQAPRNASECTDDDRAVKNEHVPARAKKTTIPQRRPRFVCTGNAVVRCQYAGRLTDATPAPDDFGACVHDVSQGGMCIYSAYPMYRGEILNVRIKGELGLEWIRSMVAWCCVHDTNVYRVGLKFLSRLDAREVDETDVVEPMGGYDTGPREASEKKKGPTKPSGADGHSQPINHKREDALKRLAAIACMRSVTTHAQRTVIVLSTSNDLTIRQKALDVLIQINTRATREALVALLHDPNREIRERAIGAVGMCEIVDAIPTLREILHDADEQIALDAAGALGQLQDWSGLRFVAATLEGDGPNVRVAVRAFSRITGHRFPANREGIASARRYWAARKKDMLRKVKGMMQAVS
jgi:HD-GYP domain-containing protein (c-di-GMP phosphodiesterase class II)